MGIVTIVVVALIVLFYKELLVSSFDTALSASLGINPTIMHYSLMSALSIVVVSAFQSVGAILVIAMLILPGATAYLLTRAPLCDAHSQYHPFRSQQSDRIASRDLAELLDRRRDGRRRWRTVLRSVDLLTPQGLLPSLLRRRRSADEAHALATS